MLKVIAALVPSAGILFVFWLALKSLVEADRRERKAEARLTRAERVGKVGGESVTEPAAGAQRAPASEPGHGPAAGAVDGGAASETA